MGYYNNFITKAIFLFEELTNEKPVTIFLGSTDFKLYNESIEYEKAIQGVPIEKEDTELEGIFIHSSSETYPYALMVECIIQYEMDNGIEPNCIAISRDFYEIFNYAFTTDEESFNPTLNCIIKILDDQYEDIVCDYCMICKSKIESYIQVIDKVKHPEETKTVVRKTPKEKFIDWLINDDEAQLEAMQYIEDHEEEINEDFILFQRECEFKRYLKDNGYDNYEEEDL